MDFRNCSFVIAEVVNTEDPLKSGRVQVRAYGEQNDENAANEEKLIWIQPMMDSTSASTGRVGKIPTGPQLGTRFFVCLNENGTSGIGMGTLHRAGDEKNGS